MGCVMRICQAGLVESSSCGTDKHLPFWDVPCPSFLARLAQNKCILSRRKRENKEWKSLKDSRRGEGKGENERNKRKCCGCEM